MGDRHISTTMMSSMLVPRLTRRLVMSQDFVVVRWLHPAVPSRPTPRQKKVTEEQVKISTDTVRHLERLSLVDFADKRGVMRLQEAVKEANVVVSLDTTGIEPLYSTLENETLWLRHDIVQEPD